MMIARSPFFADWIFLRIEFDDALYRGFSRMEGGAHGLDQYDTPALPERKTTRTAYLPGMPKD